MKKIDLWDICVVLLSISLLFHLIAYNIKESQSDEKIEELENRIEQIENIKI